MFNHRRDVTFNRVTAVTENGEKFADLSFTTEIGKPLTLRISPNDLDWLLVWGRKALDSVREGESSDG